ncbi:hypothetical protein OZK63_38920 [Streptomyces sp. UMAF16]|nr:hypothetical protein [Streptomyces sp. UMAF16]
MTPAGTLPRLTAYRPPASHAACTAPLLPGPGRATDGSLRLPSRSPVCAARGGPLPDIELDARIVDKPDAAPVALGDFHQFVRIMLIGAITTARTGRADNGKAVIGILSRLILEMLGALSEAPSVSARAALSAALAARNAAIEGDAEAVDAFSRTWLGMSRPAAWREAVEAALLGDWVEALGRGRATDTYISDLLRQHAGSEHRALQPLWERRVRGKRTALLGQPLGPGLTVQDLLTEECTAEDEALAAELADSRLLAVLRALAPNEAALARAWAASGESWAQASLDAGLPAAHGERVRRKLKRLGIRHTARAAAADTAHATKEGKRGADRADGGPKGP